MIKKTPSFEDNIAGCLHNNSKSKETIYKLFYGYLMAVILRYVNNRNDGEELVNDSFVKIFKGINTFVAPQNSNETEKAFKGWIAKIASRCAIDFLRLKRNLVLVSELKECHEPIIEVNVISELNVKDILKLLNELPEIQRIVFNLYEIDGFSHSEIAKILNIPESSSRVYLARAKSKLRTLYTISLTNQYATS
ncbi:MAG: RNA polymerase sigma factor [Sphingobacteriales bacterium]|nr:MAG: RNA polymerase sigma factor [Sphingobacteriales bacterium]